MLDLMFESEERGVLIGTVEQIARLVGCGPDELEEVIAEIELLHIGDIVHRDGIISIKNRRMHREGVSLNGNRERQKRFREKGGGKPDEWVAIRIKILKRDNYMCAYCGKKANTVDHILPKSKGGTEDDSNLVSCCKSCNQIKSNRSMEEAGFTFWKGFDAKKHQYNSKITRTSSSSTSTSNNIYTFYNQKIDSEQKSAQRAKSNIEHWLKHYPEDELMKAVKNYSTLALKRTREMRKDPANFFQKRDPAFRDYLTGVFQPLKNSTTGPQQNGVDPFFCKKCNQTKGVMSSRANICLTCDRGDEEGKEHPSQRPVKSLTDKIGNSPAGNEDNDDEAGKEHIRNQAAAMKQEKELSEDYIP